MTLENIKALLDTTGFPVAYNHFKSRVAFPFICYMADSSDNFHADNKVYKEIQHLRIELYTKQKDLISENKLKQALDGFSWEQVSETYINDSNEKYYQIIYEMEI